MGFSLGQMASTWGTGTAGQQMQLAGTVGKGIASAAYANAQNEMAKTDAAGDRAAAAQHAELILRATQRQRGAARAATAASGARVDAFSMANEQEILQAGETDAAMTILSGERKARTTEAGGEMARSAGYSNLGTSLFRGATQISGWKGIKTPAFYDGTSGDFSAPQG